MLMSHTAILQPDRRVPTGARRAVVSAGLRHLARKMDASHPALNTPGHLRDAARELDRGNTEGAQRHLRAGINDLQPVNLYRHGITDDQGHTGARQHLTSMHRQLLNVRDIEDTMQRRPVLPTGGPSFESDRLTGIPVPAGMTSGNQAMNAPRGTPSGGSGGAAEGPRAPSTPSSRQQSYARPNGHILNLSAQTARLAATPAPRGRPGGPGLYDVSGMGHTDYLQQIVKALIEKRGMPPGKAYAIARGAIRKWMRGGGHVHPEVQAAAGAAEAGELARQARARAVHGHSNWRDVEIAIELAAWESEARGPGGEWKSVGDAFNRYLDKEHEGGMGSGMGGAYTTGDAEDAFHAGYRHGGGKGDAHPAARAYTDREFPEGMGSGFGGRLHQNELEEAFRAGHQHAKTAKMSWADVEIAIELATLDFGGPGSGNPGQQRVPAGQAGGGRFTAGKGGGSPSKHPPGHPSRMHAVARHPARSMNHAQRAHAKAALLAKAHQLTQRADAIAAQIAALRAQLRSAAGTGRSAAAGSGKAAAAAATTAAAAAAAGKASTTAASTRASTSARTTSQISARISQLRAQEHALRMQAHAVRAQAAKL